MKELSPNARRLLELARHGDDPEERTVARVERQLAARIATGALAPKTTPSLASAASHSARLSALKILVTLGAMGGLGAAAWFGFDQARSTAPQGSVSASLAASAPVTSVTLTVAPSATTADIRRAREHADALHQAHAPALDAHAPDAHDVHPPDGHAHGVHGAHDAPDAPSGERSGTRAPLSAPANRTTTPLEREGAKAEEPVDSLEAEAAALRAAQRALRSGDARGALELLARQDNTFRDGSLAEERFAARVLALCESHEPRAARSEAQRFEQRYPASALLGKVRAACRDP